MLRRIHPIPLVYLSLTLLMHSLSIYSCTICIFCTFKGKHWVFSFVESVLVDILFTTVLLQGIPPNIYSNELLFMYSQNSSLLVLHKKIIANNLWDIFNRKISKKSKNSSVYKFPIHFCPFFD